MALAFEGFSIREYASKMRTVDVAKCWPFSEANKEVVEALLPPITVKKFNWWRDEVDLVRFSCVDKDEFKVVQGEASKSTQNESVVEDRKGEDETIEGAVESSEKALGSDGRKLELICPVRRVFKAATVKVMNAHVGGCLSHRAREESKKQMKVKTKAKSKAKAPKKRSIVEIFAVAPQVERVDDDDDENEEEDEDDDNGHANEYYGENVPALADILLEIKSKKNRKKKTPKWKDETLAILSKLKKKKKASKFKNKGKKESGSSGIMVGSITNKVCDFYSLK
ncbi:unnamed protein product [Ilex paraguariensis]|uniref:Uncharacterized protein n=1 Tax=Ilex paraguariensis TaxID=185542 RepID=A0ABC8T4X6_9AQUA